MGRVAAALVTSLVMSACRRSPPVPRAAAAPPSVASPPPVPSPPPAPVPPVPCDDALVEKVARGAAPLGALWTYLCGDFDKVHAVMAARTTPLLAGFVTARRRGTTVVSSNDGERTRISWQGTCVERIEEALPAPNEGIPPECLQDAEIVEQTLPPELDDMRAEQLFADPGALLRWRSCRERTPAETCLERLLPLRGRGSGGDLARARWIKVRDAARKPGAIRRETCHLALVDHDGGFLGFRCRGSLVDTTCTDKDSAYTRGQSVWCSHRQMVEIAALGPQPSEDCLRTARTALRAPVDRFTAALSAALAACAPSDPEIVYDYAFDPASATLIHLLLARQEALLGPVRFPAACNDGGACASVEGDDHDVAGVIARGCGNQIWALEPVDGKWARGTIGNGSWGGYADERRLVRLPAAAKVREPSGSSIYLVNTFAWGNELDTYQLDRPEETHTEADLIDEACVAKQGDGQLCSAYAGGRPTNQAQASEADRRRVEALIESDWPRAWPRLQRWQRELANGARLRLWDGESQRQTCTRLLIDACTGDLGEVCTRRETSDRACSGELLPDGRCREYRLARLPLLPAPPPAVTIP